MNRYPFCLFRIPENGGRVLWEITNTCNYHCSYCIFSSEAKKYDDELTTDEVKRTIKDLKENNFTYIKFTGGEPFTRKDMTEILKYASELGFDMDISTNASLITDEIAKELKNIKFPMVHVSLDGNDKASHEYVRGENTFERTLRGIKHLTENNVYTRIGTVIYKQNEDKLEELIKLARKLKMQYFLEINEEKTQYGLIEDGITYLGYRFEDGTIRVREKSIKRFEKSIEKIFVQYVNTVDEKRTWNF